MPYKDKAKQKEANRLAKQRQRQGMTNNNSVIPDGSIDVGTLAMVDTACGDKLTHGLPANYGQLDCQCMHCRQIAHVDYRGFAINV